MFFMALALNRVDFLKSFDDALVDQAFREFELEDLEFLFWYRAIECQTEQTGYLKELIEWEDVDPAPLNDDTFEQYYCVRSIFCELTNHNKNNKIQLATIENKTNEFCERMAKGNKEFSKVSILPSAYGTTSEQRPYNVV